MADWIGKDGIARSERHWELKVYDKDGRKLDEAFVFAPSALTALEEYRTIRGVHGHVVARLTITEIASKP